MDDSGECDLTGEAEPEGDGGRGVTRAMGIMDGQDDRLAAREGPELDLRLVSF